MPKKSSPAAKTRAPLTRERILRAAISFADESGLEALSMRRLATSLGVEAMSLYNHVANKEDILDGIADLVLGEIDVSSGRAGWKLAMRRRAMSVHEVLVRHPWASVVIESRTGLGPVRLNYAESMLRVLREGGFPVESAHAAILLLDSYIYGFVLQVKSWPHQGMDGPSLVEQMSKRVPADQYPNLSETMRFIMQPGARRTSSAPNALPYQAEFEFGLEVILDGLERVRNKG